MRTKRHVSILTKLNRIDANFCECCGSLLTGSDIPYYMYFNERFVCTECAYGELNLCSEVSLNGSYEFFPFDKLSTITGVNKSDLEKSYRNYADSNGDTKKSFILWLNKIHE